MYLMEWGLWRLETMSAMARAQSDLETSAAIKKLEEDFYESDIDNDLTFESVSKNPVARGPVFAFNDTYLEMRAGGTEEKRGIITLITLSFLVPMGYFWFPTTIELIYDDISHPEFRSAISVTTNLLMLCAGFVIVYLYSKYGIRFTRLEILTSRHLLVRFNRVTQQVYLHRPQYCGGIVTFPWRSTASSAIHPEDDFISSGLRLALIWHPRHSGLPHMDMTFIGKLGNGGSENRDEWEFIRRYMEDGPDSIPRPRLSTHLPSPIQAFSAQFEGMGRFIRTSGWPMKVALLMIWPAYLVIGTAHWVSLLLCWRPRWPKIIREAGRPGKPVPRVTTLEDYPLEVQERLLANADRYELKPGKRPAKKHHTPSRRKSKT